MAQISGPNAFTGSFPFLPFPQGYVSAPFESAANPGNLYCVVYEAEVLGLAIYKATSRAGSDFAAVYTLVGYPSDQYYPLSTDFNPVTGDLIITYLDVLTSSGPIQPDTAYALHVLTYNVDTGTPTDTNTGVTCTYPATSGGRNTPGFGAVACQFSTGDIGVIYSTGASGQNSSFLKLGGSPVTFCNTTSGVVILNATIDSDIIYCLYLNGDASSQPELRTVDISGTVSAASVIVSGGTPAFTTYGTAILVFGGQVFVCGAIIGTFSGVFRGDALVSPTWTPSINVYGAGGVAALCTDGTSLWVVWNRCDNPSSYTYDQMMVQQYSGSGDTWGAAAMAIDFAVNHSPYTPASGNAFSFDWCPLVLDDGTFGQVNAFNSGVFGSNYPLAAYCNYNLSAPPATVTPNYWDGAQFRLPGNAFH